MWSRRKRLTCREAGNKCEFNVAHSMVHNSLDGRVFRVRRLVCAVCGKRAIVAKRETNAFVPPAWQRDDPVEANF